MVSGGPAPVRPGEGFDAHRPHLERVARRLLGSAQDAEDAVQEAWLRLQRADREAIGDLRAWLTTVVARIALNVLRARATRREEPLDDHAPAQVVPLPDDEALLADAVGRAMAAVLDALTPPERVAFVLHDVFAVPFATVAEVLGRSPEAARQLASRARRRVRGADAEGAPDARHDRLVAAFHAAARDGDFDALLDVLDPDVRLRAETGAPGPALVVRGAREVAGRARAFSTPGRVTRLALVDGVLGLAGFEDGRLASVLRLERGGERIVAIEVLADPRRLAAVEVVAP
jgi:RNA polymerase sigma-70 factor (ECF subfamily)